MTEAVSAFKKTLEGPSQDNTIFLFLDNEVAKDLVNDPSVFAPGSVRLLSNVIDTQNASPSQGVGIAVGGITLGSESCNQLYANVAQALKDMLADGTLARLREQFNIASSNSNIGATSVATTTIANINSNVLHNFYLSKYGSFKVIIGTEVTVV